ncbi:MAG: LysR family transcriptional regulator [Terriglobales bacterium]
MLNLHHVRLFAAAAEHGNVSAAAARLRLSQPALSKQVQELEAALGVRLLERLPRGVRPTAAGELLAGYARQIGALAEEAEGALADLRGLRRGRLRLGASMTIGVYLLPRLVAGARQRWPGLDIDCEIGNTDAVQRGLVERRLDLGLVEGPGPREEQLASRTFQRDAMIVVASPALRPWPRSLAQLAAAPWVMREPGSGTRAVAERALARLGVRLHPAWTFNNPEAIQQAVLAGLGVALMPQVAVASALAEGRLRQVPVPGLTLRRPLRAQWLRPRPLTPAAAAFLASLHPAAGA